MIDKFIESHPVLLLVIAFAVIFTFICIKSSIDEKKGENSAEKEKVKSIIRSVISEKEDYVPVYAYRRFKISRYSTKCWYYALGLTAEKMYVVPLIFGESEIGHSNATVIEKESLSKIECDNLGATTHNLKFFDKNQEIILDAWVSEVNTKFDKTYPVNITQKEEAKAFMKIIEQWINEIA